MKPFNLLHQLEFRYLNRIFFAALSSFSEAKRKPSSAKQKTSGAADRLFFATQRKDKNSKIEDFRQFFPSGPERAALLKTKLFFSNPRKVASLSSAELKTVESWLSMSPTSWRPSPALLTPFTEFSHNAFIIASQILFYVIQNDYKNLDVLTFLKQWNYELDSTKINFRELIMRQTFGLAIKLLIYGVFGFRSTQQFTSLSRDFISKAGDGLQQVGDVESKLSTNEKSLNFLAFLSKFVEYLRFSFVIKRIFPFGTHEGSSAENVFSEAEDKVTPQKQNFKIYYTYRLTYEQPSTKIKLYYMGYRGCSVHPFLDEYYSSSDRVKELTKLYGSKYLKKKLLGIYLTKEEALLTEVIYHETLRVDTNEAFLNKARQSTTAFYYDNAGSTQTAESNQKRSKALKGRNRFTVKGLANLIAFQTSRERSDAEREALSNRALLRNAQKIVCPYCQKEGQKVAMHRWHFENCKKAPNPSEKSIKQREELRQRMLLLNMNKETK